MNIKFGEFVWNCYKNVQPERDMYVYVSWFDSEPQFMIKKSHNVTWVNEMYWCYVFIPDVPEIEKKEEVTILDLCKVMNTLQHKVNRLEREMGLR